MLAIRHWRAGLIGVWVFIAWCAVMLTPGQWFHFSTRGHHLVDVFGATAILLGCALRLWAGVHIRPWKGKRLVQAGPYAFCRHPLYLGSLVALLGLCLIVQSTVFLVCSVTVSTAAYGVKIHIEERNLAFRFGPAWESYHRRTPLLIPRIPVTKGAFVETGIRYGDALSELGGVCMFVLLALVAELAERIVTG